ncbi:FtsW/RodA/SpoVE family cell cycle protein [Bacteroidales bacterium OttesenSCG-928-M06]|nr:FtsW/RodA/SpoVE family cell cycle protein [Bacteroidales bacterium OttesenSCG-928-M06]
MDFVNKIFRGDRVIWMIFMFLCLISIVEVYSASSTLTFRTDYWRPILRHTIFLLVGSGIVLGVHAVKPKYFSVLAVLLPIACLLMIATRFLGTPINGSYRWISLAGITFQPSEIAKICLIGFVAFLLSRKKELTDKKVFNWILIATGVTCGIIFIDNGSTAIILAGIVFLMMFVGQIPFKDLGKIILIGGILAALLFAVVTFVPAETFEKFLPRATTWAERFKDFGGDEDVNQEGFTITDDNYQVSHANIAIANGGLIGKMPGNSSERDFLPQAYSDFIYAIIIEEMGLLGGIFVLLLYIILFIRAGIIANRTDRLFQKFLVMGAALILVTQALANMAVAVGLIPVTGQTLPLISRGGTSTLITCIYFGIILSVSRYDTPRGARREEEIEEEIEEQKVVVQMNTEELMRQFD